MIKAHLSGLSELDGMRFILNKILVKFEVAYFKAFCASSIMSLVDSGSASA